MTTKIPNNVMKPPKGFEYVTEQKKNTYRANQKS